MYIVSLTYTASLDRIDDVLPAHRAYLDAQFAAGHFVAAGPKVPRDGGVIVVSNMERERLDAILAADPFVQQGVAVHTVTEFKATRLATGLNLLRPEAAV
ncbi:MULTISPECIES: YciI family protein [unclassified Paraburkholderia]|uniref:YciI family protein n=1 Tax=unclassified Paraburkholderia TaxID=2615204 RepID=UPI002AB2C5FA|nr:MULTISPECIES: YciI family protein [unclassified Paraburkholderia]